MSMFVSRKIAEIRLPATKAIKVLHPEIVVIKGEHGVDLGALCYLRRSDKRRQKGKGRMVDLSSFSKTRAASIRKIIEWFILKSLLKELSPTTVVAMAGSIAVFIDWCDTSNHSSVLENEYAGRAALRNYILHLREMFEKGVCEIRSTYQWQHYLVSTLNAYFEIPNIELGINLIRWNRNSNFRTQMPTNNKLGKYLAFHRALFNGLCDLVLENGQFPYPVKMPEFVGYPSNTMWVFPALHAWVRHPKSTAGRHRDRAFDYIEGRIKLIEELQHFSQSSDAFRSLSMSQRIIYEANSNQRDDARIRMASIACQAFFNIFETTTGANRADIFRMEWTKELADQIAKPSTERQNFRSIKARANNREVHYQIGVTYLPLLRKFVKLRDWLLNGKEFRFMFFFYARPRLNSAGPSEYRQASIKAANKTCKFVYPEYNEINLGNRQKRAAKQDDVIRRLDPASGAKVMQHSLRTAISYYSNGSDEQAQEELGEFLNKVHWTATKSKREPGEVERSTGTCQSMNNPRAIVEFPPVEPDCQNSEGCLFCDKYKAHADEKDVRKLLSAKLVISQTGTLARSAEEYDHVFGATIKRIDRVLGEIEEVAPEMRASIERITKEVEIGAMDPYWSMKLEQLIEADIL